MTLGTLLIIEVFPLTVGILQSGGLSPLIIEGFAGDYRLEECPIPEVGEEEVLVRVLAVGVCSSDAKCYAGAAYYWGRPLLLG